MCRANMDQLFSQRHVLRWIQSIFNSQTDRLVSNSHSNHVPTLSKCSWLLHINTQSHSVVIGIPTECSCQQQYFPRFRCHFINNYNNQFQSHSQYLRCWNGVPELHVFGCFSNQHWFFYRIIHTSLRSNLNNEIVHFWHCCQWKWNLPQLPD